MELTNKHLAGQCYYQWPTSNYTNLQNQKGQNCEPKLECETPKLTLVLSY
jgi:hypothetical protein